MFDIFRPQLRCCANRAMQLCDFAQPVVGKPAPAPAKKASKVVECSMDRTAPTVMMLGSQCCAATYANTLTKRSKIVGAEKPLGRDYKNHLNATINSKVLRDGVHPYNVAGYPDFITWAKLITNHPLVLEIAHDLGPGEEVFVSYPLGSQCFHPEGCEHEELPYSVPFVFKCCNVQCFKGIHWDCVHPCDPALQPPNSIPAMQCRACLSSGAPQAMYTTSLSTII